MNKEEDLVILMSWSGESYVSEYPDPHDFVYETSGELFILDEFEGREFIGKFIVYYVDVERAMNEREPIYYVLDDHLSGSPMMVVSTSVSFPGNRQ